MGSDIQEVPVRLSTMRDGASRAADRHYKLVTCERKRALCAHEVGGLQIHLGKLPNRDLELCKRFG